MMVVTGICFHLSSLKNPTVCLGCLTVAVKNVPIGQRQPIITLRLASRVGLTQDDLPSPQLMISVVEPFVTVCGERFHLFTHQSLSSGLLRVLRPSSDIHLPVYSACPNDQTSLRWKNIFSRKNIKNWHNICARWSNVGKGWNFLTIIDNFR